MSTHQIAMNMGSQNSLMNDGPRFRSLVNCSRDTDVSRLSTISFARFSAELNLSILESASGLNSDHSIPPFRINGMEYIRLLSLVYSVIVPGYRCKGTRRVFKSL